jgi:hypothetical protein|tara:strand:+ start:83 stop:418 length:336 start_codon:yes stop_codon:yes gene_type:complete
VRLVPLGLKGHKVKLDHKAQLELLGLKAPREPQAHKVQLGLMGLMELLDLKDQQALRVQLVLRAFKARKVIQAHKGRLVLLVQQAVLVGQHLSICSTPLLVMPTLERESWR